MGPPCILSCYFPGGKAGGFKAGKSSGENYEERRSHSIMWEKMPPINKE